MVHPRRYNGTGNGAPPCVTMYSMTTNTQAIRNFAKATQVH